MRIVSVLGAIICWVLSICDQDGQCSHQLLPNPKEADPEAKPRWQDYLAEFDYTLEHKPGKANVVADALSRRAELAAIPQVKGDIKGLIREGLEHDPIARQIIDLAVKRGTKRFWVEDGLIYTRGRRLYVPRWGNIRRSLIK